MDSIRWEINTIGDILPEEFYNLVQTNKSHIEKTFPVTLSNCLDLEKTMALLETNIEKEKNNEGYYYYLRNTETRLLMGYVCIKNINTSLAKCELAYFIDKEFEGKGIISKVVAQTIAFCFHDLKMNKVFICTSKINHGSQRIALKNGFQQEGVLRDEFKNGSGTLEDVVYFGLLKSDYDRNEK